MLDSHVKEGQYFKIEATGPRDEYYEDREKYEGSCIKVLFTFTDTYGEVVGIIGRTDSGRDLILSDFTLARA